MSRDGFKDGHRVKGGWRDEGPATLAGQRRSARRIVIRIRHIMEHLLSFDYNGLENNRPCP